MKDRIGNWMQTFSGIQFWPLDPKPEEIKIEDIAHALSMICRFGGQCKKFYSVAEHSIYVSENIPYQYSLEGLLHDAAEAYIGDMIRPLKNSYPIGDCYLHIEENLNMHIRKKFNLKKNISHIVSNIDNCILIDESVQVMGGQIEDWDISESPLGIEINFWSPEESEYLFLKKFHELYFIKD